MITRFPQFRRGNIPQRLSSFRGLVMAADVVPTRIAFPKRQVRQVRPMRIDLRTVSEPCHDIRLARAAKYLSRARLHSAPASIRIIHVTPSANSVATPKLQKSPRTDACIMRHLEAGRSRAWALSPALSQPLRIWREWPRISFQAQSAPRGSP